MSDDVRDVDGSRFQIDTDAGPAVLDYRWEGDVLDLTHTGVPEEARERGIGSRLVAHAMEMAREEGLKVRPTCPFVAAWIEDHPEYRDLVAGGEDG